MESVPAKALFLLVSAVALTSISSSGEGIDETDTESFPSLPVHLLASLHPPANSPEPHHRHQHHNRPKPGGAPFPPVKPNPPQPPPLAPAPAPRSHHHRRSFNPSPHSAPRPVPPSHAPLPPTYHAPPPGYVHPGRHPILPPRSFFAAQGVVYCKPCKYIGLPTFLDAVPIHNATVELRCNSNKYKLVTATAVTDLHGYYYVDAPKTVTSFGVHRCRVFFKSLPLKSPCTNITDFHYGLHGAQLLHLEKPPVGGMAPKRLLFSIEPFAAVPSNCSH